VRGCCTPLLPFQDRLHRLQAALLSLGAIVGEEERSDVGFTRPAPNKLELNLTITSNVSVSAREATELRQRHALWFGKFTLEQMISRSFLMGILIVLIVGTVSVWLQWQANVSQSRARYDGLVLSTIQQLGQSEVDAETGQRGYLITGDPAYLAPYKSGESAIHKDLARLQSLLPATPANRIAMANLTALSDAKLAEMAKTIDLRRTNGFTAARAVVDTNFGNNTLIQIRAIETQLSQAEGLELEQEGQQSLLREKWALGLLLFFGLCLAPLLFMAYFQILRDLRQRIEISRNLTYAANHDAATGLANRRAFSTNLETAVRRAQSGIATYSLLLLDLDKFKKVNDVFGHQTGDKVLCEIARRLVATLHNDDVVARLGGDEFAIIAKGDADLHEHLAGVKHLAGRLITVVRDAIYFGENRLEIGVSIGIVLCRADSTDVGSLLRAADIAMYRAKENGRNTFCFFEQSMDKERRERDALENELIKAVKEETIKPYYQPMVNLADNRICAFEALARWRHPEQGFIPPDVFIPIIEQLGLMVDMTASILRQTCRDAKEWPADICVSINCTPSELIDPRLPSRILKIIEEENFTPTRLEVEVTETSLVSDLAVAKATLATLRGLGIKICLDDFGTGYSSLYHLRELRFDKVKIDRSFVRAMQESTDSEKIVDAILGLTKSLEMLAVAEGIENPAVRLLLANKGCEYGQGYYFAKAMSGDSVLELLKKARTLPLSHGSPMVHRSTGDDYDEIGHVSENLTGQARRVDG
jgi:diguanylate cyclase (GGDEF)-like protein